ncbi:MAG TPA: T9SS type A sorting domain-containing protein, partial [Phnomibacter sp.]|nr:T9SS type A sorting domain-containing protein [Phnomibacter sp.]
NHSVTYYIVPAAGQQTGGGGGFLSGTNRYGDLEKANYWDASASSGTLLSKIILGVGICNGPDLSKPVKIIAYDGTSGTPGAALGEINTTMEVMRGIATGGNFALFNFSPAVALPASKRIFISVAFEDLAWVSATNTAENDSLAILTTRFGEPDPSRGWEKFDNGVWYAMNSDQSWGDDINHHIYPLVSTNQTCALPVAFGALSGKQAAGGVQLNWSTYAEIDNTGFYIERSADGQKFSSLGFVPTKAANGNSVGRQQYEFVDVNPLNGANFYRIRQQDKDGKFGYSNVISLVVRNAANQNISQLYPNPANGQLTVALNQLRGSQVQVQITNAAGVVLSSRRMGVSTQGNIQLSTASLAPGMYVLKLTEENGTTSVVKFMKQ